MASVGRVALSLASGVMETTLALANFNFDFSIIRMEAPAEYRDVGNRLSKRRRKEAEEGKIHSTARKLGALFADVVPQVPNLERIYGLRASEIVADPSVNPEASSAYGALQVYVGLDATSVWAAATSGRGAIQVHLLGCILARQWKPSEAIAIWSEIVSARKSQLEERLREDQFHMGHLMAAQIDVELDKLAEWDASARAWLHAADKVFVVQQKQLMLIIDNIERTLTLTDKLYDSILQIWCNTLSFMEKVASGMALSIESPEIFLGLSSWHLYPDITVLGKEVKQVTQRDALIPLGSVITIGMQSSENQKGMPGAGILWTVPLARLKYYGRPAISTSVVGTGSSRAPFEKCIQIALGSLISDWGPDAWNPSKVFKFFVALDKRCLMESEITGNAAFRPPCYPGWTGLFAEQARKFSNAREKEQQEVLFYINLGRRRYRQFLEEGKSRVPPFFGLADIRSFLGELHVEDQVNYFRDLAAKYDVGIDLSNACIFYKGYMSAIGEIATVVPQSFPLLGLEMGRSHRRWLLMPNATHPGQALLSVGERSIDIMEATNEPCGILPVGTIVDTDGKVVDRFWGTDSGVQAPTILTWDEPANAIDLLQLQNMLEAKDGQPLEQRNVSGWRLGHSQSQHHHSKFRILCNSDSVALCIPVQEWKPMTIVPPLDFIIESFEKLQPSEAIISKLMSLRLDSGDMSPTLLSLNLLHRAATVYNMIPNATIDLTVASKPLHQASWINQDSYVSVGLEPPTDPHIPISEAFACISMFDNGIQLKASDCTGLLALSSKDVMYVSEALLDFPAHNPSAIRCIAGNIGKPGLSLLLPPSDPEVRDSLDDWQLINHAPYDGRAENNFGSTSLHLNLTGAEMPLHVGTMSGRFTEAMYVEASVQVHDRGVWFADIDVMSLYESTRLHWSWLGERLLPTSCEHDDVSKKSFSEFGQITSIDRWPEVMDPPMGISVIRAKGNWTARLALTCVLHARNDEAIICSSEPCWRCIMDAARFLKLRPEQLFVML
ncbi:hypothetical protein N0V90_007121 [Kalmusia sp. IMI 367209]|nr:hypothetical protein N0V90_007121 [Kalmusia sp. IMI 367209]